ncbi:MAG: hypothetical protein HFI64_03735 [Lachnospiraceae bacterium]|nr:hypothetical protein [Lachnospiraceae bacterium]
MKKVTAFLSILFILVSCAVIPSFAEETVPTTEDTEGPVIDLSSITLDKNKVNVGETVTLQVAVSDQSEIKSVELLFVNVDNACNATGVYNETTGLYDIKMSSSYYGGNEVIQLKAMDVYGNETSYVDKSSKYYEKWMPEGIDTDLSMANFEVIRTSSEETVPPVIQINSITMDKTQVERNETVTLSIKISDESPIAAVELLYVNTDNAYGATGQYNQKTGLYDILMSSPVYGKNEVVWIRAKDVHGNETVYVDKSSVYYETWGIEGIDVDLSAADFEAIGGNSEDSQGPTIDISSLTIDKNITVLNERTNVSVKVTDASPIISVDLLYVNIDNAYGASGSYNQETGLYDIPLYSPVYGKNETVWIRAKDAYGNETLYCDKSSSYYDTWGMEGIDADLSICTFYAGISDPATGVFVSHPTMDSTTRLHVEAKEKKGSAYDQLHQDGYESKDFYDVYLDGTYDLSSESARLFFSVPEDLKNGTSVRIRHLLSDGSIQTADRTVQNGKVWIDVNEFSPFLLEITAKEAEPAQKPGAPENAGDKNQATGTGPSSSKPQTDANTSSAKTQTVAAPTGDRSPILPFLITALSGLGCLLLLGKRQKCAK